MSVLRLPAMSLTAFLAAAVYALPASALQESNFNYETTEDLYQVCSVDPKEESSLPAVYACRAFIEATVQYHDAISDRKSMKRLICYPKGATIEGARTVFLDWARANAANAQRMREMPVVGLVRALAEKYPCK